MNRKQSLPGRYSGFSAPCYTSTRILSQYIESYDGTKLAMDLVFPVNPPKELPDHPLPVILVASRGGRFDGTSGNGDAIPFRFLSHGYILAVVELRGCGASYGTNNSFGNLEHCRDTIAAVRWLKQQPWCSGKVGMSGISNRAYIQLCTVSHFPDELDAITPTVAISDFYYQNYPNGVSAVPVSHLTSHYAAGCKEQRQTKEELLASVRPVDEDPSGDLAYDAYLTGHYGKNRMFVESLLHPNMLRDTPNPDFHGDPTNLTIPPLFRLRDFRDHKTRQHQFIGQLESGALGQLAQYKTGGGSVVLGPWTHFQSRIGNPDVPEGMLDFSAEYQRWFDASLKGIDNGFFDAPPVCYYVFGAGDGEHWRYADSWPLENVRNTTLYLTTEKSGTSASKNDGVLSPFCPDKEEAVSYLVDPSISVFDNHDGKGATYNRMTMCWNGDMEPDVDAKGLTFTTAPLFPVYENQMAGCVSVDLWVTSTAPDGDFLAYLEEVKKDGTSHFIKDGVIRASHRTSAPNEAWESMGATWHTSSEADVNSCLAEGMDKPVHLQFAIEPIAYQFEKGSRIRLTITCADNHTYQHAMVEDGNLPTIRLLTGGEHASLIRIPFVEATDNVYNGHVRTDSYDGSGTLYFFENHIYLYADGSWKRLKAGTPEAEYTVQGMEARFSSAGFTFVGEEKPKKNGVIQDYTGGGQEPQPLPACRHLYLDTVPVQPRAETLFAPAVKTLWINLFHPDRKAGKAPCIVNIHGYGQTISLFSKPMKAFYEAGYAIANVDLRNYPSNYYPDYIHDVKGAIRFLRANAERFGIDPDRIGCYGQSLGGNTALMVAISAEDENLEGTIGGNSGVSSRVQAAVAGFAWSDLLNMGKDILDEYQNEPELLPQKYARTDGEFSPCSEVIGFTGKGKGIGALREYMEKGQAGSDPAWDQKLAEAKDASPISHITPSSPPVALFGGYGMKHVDIANNQSLRTFWQLNLADVTSFLFCNTQGEYGQKPEIIQAVLTFLNRYLKENPPEKKLALREGSLEAVENYRIHTLPSLPVWERDAVWVDTGTVERVLEIDLKSQESLLPAGSLRKIGRKNHVNLMALNGAWGIEVKRWNEFSMITAKKS